MAANSVHCQLLPIKRKESHTRTLGLSLALYRNTNRLNTQRCKKYKNTKYIEYKIQKYQIRRKQTTKHKVHRIQNTECKMQQISQF